jgi:DNA-binding NarL/FixJ family response regulator
MGTHEESMKLTGLPVMSLSDWKAAKGRLAGRVSEEEWTIVEWLADGQSTPEIARRLCVSRSAAWCKVQKIKLELLSQV